MPLRSFRPSIAALTAFSGVLAGLFGGGSSARSAPAIEAGELEAALRAELDDAVKEELRSELLEELKEDIKMELAEEAAFAEPPPEDAAFADDAWKWEDPAPLQRKPPFSIHGYFRFRYDYFDNLDLGLTHRTLEAPGPDGSRPAALAGPFAPGYAPPTPLCALNERANEACRGLEEVSSLGSANMRVRLAPELAVGDDMSVKVEVDVLDNLVLGSTPDGFPNNPVSPILAFSQTQISPSDGINAVFTDSIRVKRAWIEVGTLFGDLRVGRMADEFGLGLYAHPGRGLDDDFGDSVDRVEYAVTLFGHRIAPAFDWSASGPTSAFRFSPNGQPFDLDLRDDVDQFVLTLTRAGDAKTFETRRARDGIAWTYGTRQVFRSQELDQTPDGVPQDPPSTPTPDRPRSGSPPIRTRDARIYAYAYWFKLGFARLTLEGEYAGVLGSIGGVAVGGGETAPVEVDLNLNQHAVALTAEYRINPELTLRLLVLGASGDSASGWGALPLGPIGAAPSRWEGPQAGPGDRSITNFRVDPSFVVDMVFWRQLVGLVTDALVIRPSAQVDLVPGSSGFRVDLVYSRAWKASSTPSADSTDLGVEIDTRLFFNLDFGLRFWFEYGVFFPLAALDWEANVAVTGELTEPRRLEASVAHTFQALVGFEF